MYDTEIKLIFFPSSEESSPPLACPIFEVRKTAKTFYFSLVLSSKELRIIGD